MNEIKCIHGKCWAKKSIAIENDRTINFLLQYIYYRIQTFEIHINNQRT